MLIPVLFLGVLFFSQAINSSSLPPKDLRKQIDREAMISVDSSLANRFALMLQKLGTSELDASLRSDAEELAACLKSIGEDGKALQLLLTLRKMEAANELATHLRFMGHDGRAEQLLEALRKLEASVWRQEQNNKADDESKTEAYIPGGPSFGINISGGPQPKVRAPILVEQDSVRGRHNAVLVNQTENLSAWARSQLLQGDKYHYGHGVPVDHALARQYYELSADQTHDLAIRATAQTHLGDMYRLGLGVAVSHARAREYFQLAANQTDNLEMRKEAQMHLDGLDP